MLLRRTLGAHSIANEVVSESRPALAAPYTAVPGEGRSALMEEMLTIAPPPTWPCMTRLAAWATTRGPEKLRSSTLAWKRGEASAASAYGAPPALLTATSRRPSVAATSSTIATTASGSRTSQVTWRVPGSAPASERAQVTTRAPAAAYVSAMARPMPLLPPVTSTTRPVRSMVTLMGVLRSGAGGPSKC